MDVQVDEVNGEVTMFDIESVQREITRVVMARIAEEQRLQHRRNEESKLRRSASDRPEEIA
jgi:replication fork clamp-binding protein CrfC